MNALNRARPGTTMTEMTVFLSVLSVILTLATGLLHRTFATYTNCLRQEHTNHAMRRFVRSVRADVRGAIELELPDPVPVDTKPIDTMLADALLADAKPLLTIVLDKERRAEFIWIGEKLRRDLTVGGNVVAQEEFALPSAPRCELERIGDDPCGLRIEIPWNENPPVAVEPSPGSTLVLELTPPNSPATDISMSVAGNAATIEVRP